jgi:hypothetical protein
MKPIMSVNPLFFKHRVYINFHAEKGGFRSIFMLIISRLVEAPTGGKKKADLGQFSCKNVGAGSGNIYDIKPIMSVNPPFF